MHVLFTGNSQMFFYDLPRMVETLSQSAPPDAPRITAGRALVGGATLKKHWENPAPDSFRNLLASQKWDAVILQELFRTDEPEFVEYAAKCDEAVRGAGSRTLLFATANVTEAYNPAFRYPDGFHKLNDMQIAFGRKHNIPVASAGYAWIKYLGPNPSESRLLDLYDPDKGHPGAKGTYLYACLLYAHLTQRTPVGLTHEFKDIRDGITIPRAEAARMQYVAWSHYLQTPVPV